MEKFFSVVVELESGERKTIRIAGDGPGGVFQQAKAMPGVRRVGKVSPADQSTPSHGGASGGATSDGQTRVESHPGQQTARGQQAGSQRGSAEYANSGPRVVSHARRAAVEQPFKNLHVPAERLAPPKPDKPKTPERPAAPAPAPKPKAAPPPQVAPEVPEASPSPGVKHEYRIIKSRRQGGSPFILQRGTWKDNKGKRVFEVDWEKGFDDREKAAQHQQWVGETEQELAEVEQHA